MTNKRLKSNFILREYEIAAMDVPARDPILLVPKIVNTGVWGRLIKSAGNWINPSPPTMESINPAKKENPASSKIVATEKSEKNSAKSIDKGKIIELKYQFVYN